MYVWLKNSSQNNFQCAVIRRNHTVADSWKMALRCLFSCASVLFFHIIFFIIFYINNISLNLNGFDILLHTFYRTNGFRPLLDNNAPRATPPIFLPSHLASLGTQFHPPLFPHLKGRQSTHAANTRTHVANFNFFWFSLINYSTRAVMLHKAYCL